MNELYEKLNISVGDTFRNKKDGSTYTVLPTNSDSEVRMEELTPADSYYCLNTPARTFFLDYEIINKYIAISKIAGSWRLWIENRWRGRFASKKEADMVAGRVMYISIKRKLPINYYTYAAVMFEINQGTL